MPVVRLHGVDVATAICEDLWQEGGPVRAARAAGAGLLVVPNASPYEYAKDATREGLVAQRAAEAGCPIVYTNLVGGQDELVFDGGCFVVDGAGRVIARGERFTEGVVVVDLDLAAANDDAAGPVVVGTGPAGQPETMTVRRRTLTTAPLTAWDAAEPPLAPEVWDEPQVWAALVLGLRDYVRKNGFRTVVLGMSGGIDSAVVAALAADAIGGENVIGISMPSKYSSQHSRDDAADLAERIGARYLTVPIAPMFEAFMASQTLSGVAEENLQARIRGTTLMAWSNQHGSLVLAPGNKSELATGYSTIYGDAVGGFGPIKDVPKSLVFAIARWRNAEAERRGETPPIPPSSIEKPPSAELRPDQKDTDSLPDYAVLDQVIEDYIVHDRGYAELLLQGHPREVVEQVLALTDRAEWKRRQYPPGTKITPRAFGRDRRQPITNRWREPGV
jgi:NAD+ synthase (glutamine-hydrolysing)